MRSFPIVVIALCSGCLFPIDIGDFSSSSGALEGDPCDAENVCAEGLACGDDSTCTAIPIEREPCDAAGVCPDGHFCDRDGLCSEVVPLGPIAVISETGFGMGVVVLGSASVGDVNIDNFGDAPLEITRVSIAGVGADQFSLTTSVEQQSDGSVLIDPSSLAAELTNPLVIEPDGEGAVWVVFQPTIEADSTVTILVETNDPASAALEVLVRGVGALEPDR